MRALRPPAPIVLAPVLLLWGCLGGQSGDDGLGNQDPMPPMVTTAEATPEVTRCQGEADGRVAGACTHVAAGWDCRCGEQGGLSDAALCEDALRERCGLEPVPQEPSCDADDDAGACL